jgi:hypothetical protein
MSLGHCRQIPINGIIGMWVFERINTMWFLQSYAFARARKRIDTWAAKEQDASGAPAILWDRLVSPCKRQRNLERNHAKPVSQQLLYTVNFFVRNVGHVTDRIAQVAHPSRFG